MPPLWIFWFDFVVSIKTGQLNQPTLSRRSKKICLTVWLFKRPASLPLFFLPRFLVFSLQTKWISTTNHLPPHGGQVFVLSSPSKQRQTTNAELNEQNLLLRDRPHRTKRFRLTKTPKKFWLLVSTGPINTSVSPDPLLLKAVAFGRFQQHSLPESFWWPRKS